MLKDDRMMSMLTFVVIMAAIGAVLQRVDVFERLFGNAGPELELARDEVIVVANKMAVIDVLANDKGLPKDAAEKLIVVTQPKCGRANPREGKVQFLANDRCLGPQRFNYAVSGFGEGLTGEVTAMVRLGDPAQNQVSADAQRDIPTPVPADTSKAVARNDADPAALAVQQEGSQGGLATAMSAPSVPRPQAGQAPGFDSAPAPTSLGGGDTLSLSPSGGSGPSFVQPGAPSFGSDPLAAPPRPNQPSAPGQLAALAPAPAPAMPAANGVARAVPSGLEQAPAAPDAGADAPVAALSPILGGGGSASGGSLAPVSPAAPPELAAADGQVPPVQPAQPAGPCTTPATLTLDIRPSAITEVSVHSPCDAMTVATISYDGLAFGFPLDGVGLGSIRVPGLQPSSNAELQVDSGNGFTFDLAFQGTESMDRVAVAWRAPVQLDLHAFEFGAKPDSDGHVSPARPRGFDEVRRKGGGYLLSWTEVRGIGDNVSVYTYWRRPGGPTGVVDMALDFASRDAGNAPETCGTGAQAHPEFEVIRSLQGRIQPVERRRIAPLDCAAVASAQRLIGDAVEDILIRRQ